jgi:galactokinase/mevalonate kinase-like predicted kinase
MPHLTRMPEGWDYLILTASHDAQAAAYEAQLRARREAGALPRVRQTLVVADLEGRRIGSGGSTLQCLALVVERERSLARLRILIVHAGGDSRRLPAYGPCGKIFVPVPGESHSAFGATLFDRLAETLLDLPAGLPGRGQVVVAAGDALNLFDAFSLDLAHEGITFVGGYASPEEATRHGVYCVGARGELRLFLQKPSLAVQQSHGAIDRYGRTVLDIGLMSFDARAAEVLLEAFGARVPTDNLDLYREICCALGSEATPENYIAGARASGSKWDGAVLEGLFPALHEIPSRVEVLPRCRFLHFGSTRQLVQSGRALLAEDRSPQTSDSSLCVNSLVTGAGAVSGADSWVEGCRITAPLTLGGQNVVVGLDVSAALALPRGACLEVLASGDGRWFVRCYGVHDTFKDAGEKATFCGHRLSAWLAAVGVAPGSVGPADGSLWDARVFPAVTSPEAYRDWLWMFDVDSATAAQKQAWIDAPRYSAAEIAVLTDQAAFHDRRLTIRAAEIRGSLHRLFARESTFSAADLAVALHHAPDRDAMIDELLALARSYEGGGMESFVACRILHSLSTALGGRPELRERAFRELNETILTSSLGSGARPRQALRPDETIWGRGPARIELGGGWTDTPPYTLEYGGDVINTAVNLNGQPPIHCYCRVIAEPLIRLHSIDGGTRLEITELGELLDYRRPEDRFALAKAALAISGFSPQAAAWDGDVTLRAMLGHFGGGIELTTLVGIPKGSGLGTSSILGAVILAVVHRMMGRSPGQRELFHDVLRLEQALTTGGGWQDQIGGGVGGTKITSTRPGLIPDARIHYVPSDLIDPRANGGTTLLYYTGLTRLAKNILQEIVGKYFDRHRAIMATLAEEHLVAHAIADAMGRKDAAAFGYYVNAAWELQKRLCGTVTNDEIERLLARVRPHVHGMRISGAGSGGFLLMIAKSAADAARVREMLEREPLNERSRFFDFEVNHTGLEVTTC